MSLTPPYFFLFKKRISCNVYILPLLEEMYMLPNAINLPNIINLISHSMLPFSFWWSFPIMSFLILEVELLVWDSPVSRLQVHHFNLRWINTQMCAYHDLVYSKTLGLSTRVFFSLLSMCTMLYFLVVASEAVLWMFLIIDSLDTAPLVLFTFNFNNRACLLM